MATADRKTRILGRLEKALSAGPRRTTILAEYEEAKRPKPAQAKPQAGPLAGYQLSPMWILHPVHSEEVGDVRAGFSREVVNKKGEPPQKGTKKRKTPHEKGALYRLMTRADGMGLFIATDEHEHDLDIIRKEQSNYWSYQANWIVFIQKAEYDAWVAAGPQAPLVVSKRPMVWRMFRPNEPDEVNAENVSRFFLEPVKVAKPEPPAPELKTLAGKSFDTWMKEYIANAGKPAAKAEGGYIPVPAGPSGPVGWPQGGLSPFGWQHGDVRKSPFREGWERYNGDLMLWEQLNYDPTRKPKTP